MRPYCTEYLSCDLQMLLRDASLKNHLDAMGDLHAIWNRLALVFVKPINDGEEDRRERYWRIAIKGSFWMIEGLIGRSLQWVSNGFCDFTFSIRCYLLSRGSIRGAIPIMMACQRQNRIQWCSGTDLRHQSDQPKWTTISAFFKLY